MTGGIFWGSFIEFLTQAYLEIVFALALQTYDFKTGSYGYYISTTQFWVFVVIVVVLPIW